MTKPKNKYATFLASDICREFGFSRQAFHEWKQKLGLRPYVRHARLHYYTLADVEAIRNARRPKG